MKKHKLSHSSLPDSWFAIGIIIEFAIRNSCIIVPVVAVVDVAVSFDISLMQYCSCFDCRSLLRIVRCLLSGIVFFRFAVSIQLYSGFLFWEPSSSAIHSLFVIRNIIVVFVVEGSCAEE